MQITNPDLMGVVANFLTIPEVALLDASTNSNVLRPEYVAGRLADIDAMESTQRDDEYERMFRDQLDLAFPALFPRFGNNFPWGVLVRYVFQKDREDVLQWVLNNKQDVPDVRRWTQQWLFNLANEPGGDYTDQRYWSYQERVWRMCVVASIEHSVVPAVVEWERLLCQTLASSSPQSWFLWLIDCARHQTISGLATTDFNNALLCRLAFDRLPSLRSELALSLFTKPVDRTHYGARLTAAITTQDARTCRLLSVYLRAEPSPADWCLINDKADDNARMSAIRTLFRTAKDARIGEEYFRNWEERSHHQALAFAKRRRAVLEAYDGCARCDGAKRRRADSMHTIESDETRNRRQMAKEFTETTRVLNHIPMPN